MNQPSGSGNRTTIIIIIVLVVLCCLCVAVAGVGGAGYFFLQKASTSTEPITAETVAPFEMTVTPEEQTATTAPEDTATPAEMATPADVNVPTTTGPVPSAKGMGVSRDQMIQYFNSGDAFDFGSVKQLSGLDAVTGIHKTLCVKGDCAAVTLLGPADDLLAVSAAVPTDPKDNVQTLTAITLLMNAAQYFSGDSGDVPTKIMVSISAAQVTGKDFDDTTTSNGYSFNYNFNSKNGVASIAISKQK
jgi:hypothetical protein